MKKILFFIILVNIYCLTINVNIYAQDPVFEPKPVGMDNKKINGYRGIWFELNQKYEYGDKSVKAELLGTVYGDIYRETLLNRLISSYSLIDDHLLILWGDAIEQSIGTEITYYDQSGISHSLLVSSNQDSSLLQNYQLGSELNYQNLYLPVPMAIDTFFAKEEKIVFKYKKIESEINKSNFQLFDLPVDYSEAHNSSSEIEHIWNNNSMGNSPTYISKVNGHVLPQWFTIDLGNEYELTKIKLYQRGNLTDNLERLYAGGNVKEFEVWGSFEPDPEYNPDEHDGLFDDSWILLASCTVDRPSGSTLAPGALRSDNTPEDIAAAVAGHEFIFENSQKIRYLRINVLENWRNDGSEYVNIAAINLWAWQNVLISDSK